MAGMLPPPPPPPLRPPSFSGDNETQYMGIECGYHYSWPGISLLAHAVADRFTSILKGA